MDRCPLGEASQCLEQPRYILVHSFVQNLGEDIGVRLIRVTDDTKLGPSSSVSKSNNKPNLSVKLRT